jgi:hypothetical protein
MACMMYKPVLTATFTKEVSKAVTDYWMLLKYLVTVVMLWRLELVLEMMFWAELARFIADL